MNNRSSKNNQIRQTKLKNDNQKNNIKQQLTQQDNTLNSEISHLKSKNKKTKNKNILPIVIIFCITFLVAILGTIMGGKMIDGRINPPAYPPNWVFPLAWGILYVIISIASSIAFIKSNDNNKRKCSITWYGVHLFFNLFWPLFFFRLNSLIISCFILLLMIITAIVLTFKYFRTHLLSGWVFTIYTLWLIYAMYLNLGITLLNL